MFVQASVHLLSLIIRGTSRKLPPWRDHSRVHRFLASCWFVKDTSFLLFESVGELHVINVSVEDGATPVSESHERIK